MNNYSFPEVESRTQGSWPRPRTQKKIRGQGLGHPFREQTLSRPRTEMLEAKAKNQGHRRKCSPRKKRSSQIFSEVSGVFLYNFKNEQIPAFVGTDANAHHRRSQDCGLGRGGGQTRNHISEDQTKRVFTVRFRICDWGWEGGSEI